MDKNTLAKECFFIAMSTEYPYFGHLRAMHEK